jgi:fatty-acyl-CoA synthase
MPQSYAKGELEPPLLEQTIGANFEATVAAHPDREALVEFATGRRWTWSELDRDVDALAIGLIRAGIGKGDRVGIWSPNCAEWTLVQFATAKIGAILVNINPAYRTHELAYALNQSGTKLLISASEFKTSNYRAMVDQVRDQVSVEQVWFLVGT